MEPTLIIALVMAFGVRADSLGGPLPRSLVMDRLAEVAVLLVVQIVFVIALGQILRHCAARGRSKPSSLRRSLARCSRAASLLSLAAFAYVLFGLDWPGIVENGLGLRHAILLDEILILAPYLIIRFATWWGLYPAERAIRQGHVAGAGRPSGVGRFLVQRARQSLGLVLPATLIYSLGNDVVDRWWPGATQSPYAPMVGMFLMGSFVLLAAPAFVRLTWPTRSLPPGPLRDRLERLARRLRFRYTDILIWETGGGFVNAGVTGAVPFYRYVLLTDTLVEGLDEREVEAVFGHEVGHIAHRHLAYFGFFFVGSLGVMALVGKLIDQLTLSGILDSLLLGTQSSQIVLAVQSTSVLGFLALYFLLVFGFVSRRFERQADVYGCHAVSCGRLNCPPHLDINGSLDVVEVLHTGVCPVGIRIFANALANVALLNGMEPKARSWRHGSISRRIAFLEGLEGRPDRERRFQQSIHGLRLIVAAGLVAAFIIAQVTGALEQL